jgi:hypothetical protein
MLTSSTSLVISLLFSGIGTTTGILFADATASKNEIVEASPLHHPIVLFVCGNTIYWIGWQQWNIPDLHIIQSGVYVSFE